MDVHEKIKVMRLFKNLTQEEMAEKLGYQSTQGYAKIERGETEPTLGKLEDIAEILGVSLQDLLGLNESNVVHIAGNCCQHIRHNYSQNLNLTLLTETECAYKLEKAHLTIEQLNKEISYLKEIVELMKNKTDTGSD